MQSLDQTATPPARALQDTLPLQRHRDPISSEGISLPAVGSIHSKMSGAGKVCLLRACSWLGRTGVEERYKGARGQREVLLRNGLSPWGLCVSGLAGKQRRARLCWPQLWWALEST